MSEIRKKRIGLDIAIIMICCLSVMAVWYFKLSTEIMLTSLIAALLILAFFLIDCLKQLEKKDEQAVKEQAASVFLAHELALLDEEEKPIRSWNLLGKTAVIIGRRYKDAEVDVDLSDCEYSALINVQHAVLNYCLDSWYLEDLGSQNGIQIRKADDGKCYRITTSRPCKITAGDVIYIAKTKLLVT